MLFMKKHLALGFLAFLLGNVSIYKAQRNEIGVRLGVNNLVGDIGNTNYFIQRPFASVKGSGFPVSVGGFYRFNFNPQQSLRLDVGYNRIKFYDELTQEEYRRNRGTWGNNNAFEASLLFEYNFLGINNEQRYGMFSPYIFAGFGAMMHNISQVKLFHDFTRDVDGVALAPTHEEDFVTSYTFNKTQKITPFIPFGIGLKYKFNYNWTVSVEAMLRPTFSDQLDYSHLRAEDIRSEYSQDIITPSTNASLLQVPEYYNISLQREKEFLKNRQIGETKGKDWVNSVTIGLSYSFGRPPCYCD